MKTQFSWHSTAGIPRALVLGHDEVRAELVRATAVPGRIGEAAQAVARLCLPHFEQEEKTVFPIFALLPELVEGTVRPEMAEVLPLISTLAAWQESSGKEHQSISDAIHAMLVAAYKDDNREIVEFGYCLRVHERLEDDVIYPTALMIGKYVRERLGV